MVALPERAIGAAILDVMRGRTLCMAGCPRGHQELAGSAGGARASPLPFRHHVHRQCRRQDLLRSDFMGNAPLSCAGARRRSRPPPRHPSAACSGCSRPSSCRAPRPHRAQPQAFSNRSRVIRRPRKPGWRRASRSDRASTASARVRWSGPSGVAARWSCAPRRRAVPRELLRPLGAGRRNSRTENAHQPTREPRRQRFKDPGHPPRFLSAYGPIVGHFRPCRHHLNAAACRESRNQRFAMRRTVTGTPRRSERRRPPHHASTHPSSASRELS